MTITAMRTALLAAVLMLTEVAAQDSRYVYVEVDSLRQEKDRAQRDWQRLNPDLESYLATAPKNQVLREIELSRAAAARFSDLEVRYYDSRLQVIADQIRSLEPNREYPSNASLSLQMQGTIRGLLENIAEDRQSAQTRLDQLNRISASLTPEQLLARGQLVKELAALTESYFQLEAQKRKLEAGGKDSDTELAKQRAAMLASLRAVDADTRRQRELASRGRDLFESYYRNLGAAVEKRRDDAPTEVTNRPATQARGDNVDKPSASTRRPDMGKPADSTKPTRPQPFPTPAPPNRTLDGTWVIPEGSLSTMIGECNLKAAEMSLRAKTPPFVGTVKLHYAGSMCPSYLVSPVTLNLAGGKGSQTAAAFDVSGTAARMAVTGRFEVQLASDGAGSDATLRIDRSISTWPAGRPWHFQRIGR